jgi:GT2 family glycosyltransferase
LPYEQTTTAVSVIIVNWNRAEFLRESLTSLAAQLDTTGRPFPLEIIVVDNASTDHSVDMIMSDFPYVLLLKNQKNLGFCAANNQGIAVASHPHIALLNNDAVAHPNWIQQLQAGLQAAPDIGMTASKILDYTDPSRIDKTGHLIFPDGQNRGRGTGEADRGQYDQQEEVLWPDGCAAMYRKAMLDQIGAFDEDLFAYGDDAELGLRARIAGWRCLYMPEAVVRHRRGSTLGQGNPDRVRLIERNRILLAVKLFPWSLLLLNPLFFTLRLLAGLFAAGAGQGDLAAFPGFVNKLRVIAALIHGQWQALLLLPRTLRKRTAVRRIAVLTPAQLRRLILSNRLSLPALFGIAPRTEVAP